MIAPFTPAHPSSSYYNPGYSPSYVAKSYRRQDSDGTPYQRHQTDDPKLSYHRQSSDDRNSFSRKHSDDQRVTRRDSYDPDRAKRKTSTRNVIYSEQDVGKIMTRAYDPGLWIKCTSLTHFRNIQCDLQCYCLPGHDLSFRFP
jgi:hypothetical protein